MFKKNGFYVIHPLSKRQTLDHRASEFVKHHSSLALYLGTNFDARFLSLGKVTVPFSISNIAEGTEGYGKEHYGYVCLGQIPNINNAKRIIYAVDADSGSGLFIAMNTDDKSVTHQYNWYNFHVTPEKN